MSEGKRTRKLERAGFSLAQDKNCTQQIGDVWLATLVHDWLGIPNVFEEENKPHKSRSRCVTGKFAQKDNGTTLCI